MSPLACGASFGSYEYATASTSPGACSRQNRIAASGSSQVEKGTGDLPCLRREKRSSSAAATISPSTTSAAAGSWKTALMPRTALTARLAVSRAPPHLAGARRDSACSLLGSGSRPAAFPRRRDDELFDLAAGRLAQREEHRARGV